MQWNHLRLLLALKEGGSMAAAGRLLQVEHSTVSRQVQALEADMGAQLLLRGREGLIWTPVGLRMLRAAEEMDAVASRAAHDARSALQESVGVVRISAPTGYLPMLVEHVLPALHEAHRDLRIELNGTYRQVDLAKGAADIAIRMARPTEPDMVVRHAFTEAWFIYSSKDYVERRGSPHDLSELARHDLVLYAPHLHALEPLAWLEQFVAQTGTELRVDNIEAALQLVEVGAGISVLPGFAVPQGGQLVRLPFEPVALKKGWIVFHEALRHSSRVKNVVQALNRFFRAQGNRFGGT